MIMVCKHGPSIAMKYFCVMRVQYEPELQSPPPKSQTLFAPMYDVNCKVYYVEHIFNIVYYCK